MTITNLRAYFHTLITFTISSDFSSSEEVLHILGKILGCLQRGRTCLVVPRKKTVEEIIKSGNMVNATTMKRLLFESSFLLLWLSYKMRRNVYFRRCLMI